MISRIRRGLHLVSHDVRYRIPLGVTFGTTVLAFVLCLLTLLALARFS